MSILPFVVVVELYVHVTVYVCVHVCMHACVCVYVICTCACLGKPAISTWPKVLGLYVCMLGLLLEYWRFELRSSCCIVCSQQCLINIFEQQPNIF